MIKFLTHFFTVLLYNPSWNTHYSGVCWNVFYYNRSASDFRFLCYRNVTEYLCTSSYKYIILNSWVTFPFLMSCPPNGYTLVNCHVITTFTRFTYNDSHTMVDKKTSAYFSTGMNFNAR